MTSGNPRVLIVDDEPAIGQILKAGLELHGFTVRYESIATKALAAGLEFRPDLVLLDVDMPTKDGGRVAAEMRAHRVLRHTCVIFLTSLVSKAEAARPYPSGEIFLSKPIPIAVLVGRIRSALAARASQTDGAPTPHGSLAATD